MELLWRILKGIVCWLFELAFVYVVGDLIFYQLLQWVSEESIRWCYIGAAYVALIYTIYLVVDYFIDSRLKRFLVFSVIGVVGSYFFLSAFTSPKMVWEMMMSWMIVGSLLIALIIVTVSYLIYKMNKTS